ENRFAKLEQKRNNPVDRLENGDNSENVVNIPNPVIDQCINSNSKSLVDDTREIDQSLINTTPIKMENSNNTPASENTSNSDDKKGTDKLQQELFNTSLETSLQDHSISKNIKPGQIEISETARPEKIESVDGSAKCIVNSFDINEVSQHLAQLCDTAIGAEDRASKANQEEIICWSLYGRDFEFQVGEMSSKNKIGEKKARTLIYNEIENQLSILQIRISNSPSLEITHEVFSEDNIIEISGTARLEKISPHNEASEEAKKTLPETEVSVFPEKVSPEKLSETISEESTEASINVQPTPSKLRSSISILPKDPEKKQKHVIKIVLERFPYLTLKHSFKYKGEWGSGEYCGEKTYRLYCYINKYQNSIHIVTVKA
ncbi:25775_t:CDS:2, partial [Gigaspora margarita]